MASFRLKDFTQISLFTAFLAISSIFVIPIGPVPLTFQVFFFLLIPALLGAKKGTCSILLYIILGLIGMPVFAGGTGGIHSLLSPSFGYLIGALVSSLYIGKMTSYLPTLSKMIVHLVFALLIIYLFGIFYQFILMNKVLHTAISVQKIILTNVAVFFPIDLIKVFLVAGLYNRLRSVLKLHP